jgi:hypothetical protein
MQFFQQLGGSGWISVGSRGCEAVSRRALATANSTFAKAICWPRARPGHAVRQRLLSLAQTSVSALVDDGVARATTAAAEGYPSAPAAAFRAEPDRVSRCDFLARGSWVGTVTSRAPQPD